MSLPRIFKKQWIHPLRYRLKNDCNSSPSILDIYRTSKFPETGRMNYTNKEVICDFIFTVKNSFNITSSKSISINRLQNKIKTDPIDLKVNKDYALKLYHSKNWIFDLRVSPILEHRCDYFLVSRFLGWKIIERENLIILEADYEDIKIFNMNIAIKYAEMQKVKSEMTVIYLRERIKQNIRDNKIINKVYKNRSFTGRLRQMILERDNYTCQRCGRTLDQCKELGYSLEIDHIVEYEDGGETTYNNGQVLCSDCNKGKNKIKKIKPILERHNIN